MLLLIRGRHFSQSVYNISRTLIPCFYSLYTLICSCIMHLTVNSRQAKNVRPFKARLLCCTAGGTHQNSANLSNLFSPKSTHHRAWQQNHNYLHVSPEKNMVERDNNMIYKIIVCIVAVHLIYP